MEHIRHGRSLPRLPLPVDFNPVSILHTLVATFGLVFELKNPDDM